LVHIREKLRIPSLVFVVTMALSIIHHWFTSNNTLVGYLEHFFTLFTIFSISWLIMRFASLGKDFILRRYDIEEKDNLKARSIYTQFKIISAS